MRFWQVASLLVVAGLPLTSAFRSYLARIPNGASVPGSGSGAIHGICEAWGHEDCDGKGEVIDIGEAFKEPPASSPRAESDSEGQWSVGFCSADTDGDGLTNGDELGDGCCAWKGYDVGLPDATTDISHPGNAASISRRPGCSGVAPSAPTGLSVSSVTVSGALLSWTPANASTHCVCEYAIALSVGGAAATTFGARGASFSLCGLPATTLITVTVAALNRGGASPPSAPLVFSTAGSGAGTSACSVRNASPFYMNTAGTNLNPYNANIVLILPAVACLGIACLLGLAATMMCSDPVSPARYSLLHTHCCGRCRGGSAYVRVGSTLRKHVGGLGWSGVGTPVAYIAATAAVALALAITWAVATSFFSHYMPYAYARDLGEPVWRAAGYALAVALGLALLPPAKNSLWLRVFGASFERALRVHRWAGFMVAVLTCVHGIGLGVAYGRAYGAAYLFKWSSATSVNPLAGSLAGIAICVMSILAWEPIRRRWYGLFLAGHLLWPLIVLFTFLHTKDSSEIGAVFPLLLGTVLMGLDYAWRAMDACARPVRVTDVALVAGEDGVTPDVVALCLTKDGMRPPHPGSFVYLLVPSISLVPHPFSVSSPPAVSASGYDSSSLSAFTLHIKASRPSSFTGALLKRVAAATSKRASSAVVPLSDAGGAVTVSNPSLPGSASPSPTHGAGVLQRFLGLAGAATGDSPSPYGTLAWPAPGAGRHASPSPPRLPPLYVFGPFGKLSLHIDRYEHVLLVAGGIGITPIASLHYSLQHGLATGDAVSAPGADGSTRAVPLRTLTTVWTVRSTALVQEFAPLLLPQAASGARRSDDARASPSGAGSMPRADSPAAAYSNPSALCTTNLRIHCTTATRPNPSRASAAVVTSPPARAAAFAAGSDAEPGILMTSPVGRSSPAPAAPDAQTALRPYLQRGRADIAQTVAALRQQVMQGAPPTAAVDSRAVAVVVCGPAALVEEVVRHCHAASADGACRFHVHTETFEF